MTEKINFRKLWMRECFWSTTCTSLPTIYFKI